MKLVSYERYPTMFLAAPTDPTDQVVRSHPRERLRTHVGGPSSAPIVGRKEAPWGM